MRRTDLLDTQPWVHKEMIRRLRLMTPEERLRIAIERTEMGLEIARLARERMKRARAE